MLRTSVLRRRAYRMSPFPTPSAFLVVSGTSYPEGYFAQTSIRVRVTKGEIWSPPMLHLVLHYISSGIIKLITISTAGKLSAFIISSTRRWDDQLLKSSLLLICNLAGDLDVWLNCGRKLHLLHKTQVRKMDSSRYALYNSLLPDLRDRILRFEKTKGLRMFWVKILNSESVRVFTEIQSSKTFGHYCTKESFFFLHCRKKQVTSAIEKEAALSNSFPHAQHFQRYRLHFPFSTQRWS